VPPHSAAKPKRKPELDQGKVLNQSSLDFSKRGNLGSIPGSKSPSPSKMLPPVVAGRNEKSNEVIAYFGPDSEIRLYKLGPMEWEFIGYEEACEFNGGTKYLSACLIPGSKVFLSGGVNLNSKTPIASCYEINKFNLKANSKKPPMVLKKFGHSSAYLNGHIYCFGGFANREDYGEAPKSLNQCERLRVNQNQWEFVAPMNEGRAFAACCVLQDQYIYVFGGMHDYTVLQNIEKYDSVTDVWITLYVKLPMPLAKSAAIAIDKRHILLLGGMQADYNLTNKLHNLDINSLKWIKKAHMKCDRDMHSGAFLATDQYIYALGGGNSICERYSLSLNKWELLPFYNEGDDRKDFTGWVGAISQT